MYNVHKQKIQLQSNVPTYTIEVGQHSLRLANARCYEHDVISKPKMISCWPLTFTSCRPILVRAWRFQAEELRRYGIPLPNPSLHVDDDVVVEW
ncbi:unnamed protein product [Heligmosomoides polygyrus]|uniref:Neur_chan_LBD domain-containing protein n=1 Tax=Heligmosomoides polygyrus TaxID=6339 RepID=A0A183FAS2_HELPZ|nr:unnamed protein product [Heligmosomoides polygyrus]